MKDFEVIGIPYLFGKKFFIPNYQRGYRWDIRQIHDLLDDICHFYENASDGEFYCLQPIIVASNETHFVVIDGQQRLTTLFIILSYLSDARKLLMSDTSMFEIEYETRPDSEQYLKEINQTSQLDDQNVDYYFMSQAYMYIKKWFEDNHINKGDFLNALLKDKKNVTLIWYEVEASSAEAVDLFTRVNMWKIPLTNSELIKGILFSSKTWGENREYAQLLTSVEWDMYEQTLQKDDFWFFINKEKKVTSTYTHMDLIFEILADKYISQVSVSVDKDIDAYYSFYILNELLEKKMKTHKDLWSEVKVIYRMFEEWYNNNEYYHLVGFLSHSEANIRAILDQFSRVPKREFKEYLISEIRSLLSNGKRPILNSDDLRELSYLESRDYSDLYRVVLLHNVITSMNSRNIRFPFDRLINEKWSLEHIHAQNSEMIRKNSMRISILTDQLGYFQKNYAQDPIALKIQQILAAGADVNENEFESVQNEVFKKFGDELELHSIDNLALLTRNDNSALNNNIFPIKRDTIKQLDAEGSFIPICTRNVFQKYYSQNPENLIKWESCDRDGYYSDIVKSVGEFMFAEGGVE